MPAPVNVAEFEALARERVEPPAWDYYAGGADDERSVADNVAAWGRIRLRPRMLVNVAERSMAAAAFGVSLPHPILVAPIAVHGLAHADGETASARGAAAAGALYTLSTISSRPLEEVADAAPGAPRWFQLYTSTIEGATEAIVRRAADAGYQAVVLTVDLPYPGKRERDLRSGHVTPLGAHLPADQPVDPHGLIIHPTFDWDDLAWLRSVCPVPLVAKGILRADDARRAVEAGCEGVWVSNHGGRQLDTAIAGADAVAHVADAVGDRALIVVDGGVRRGTDVLKGLALGANLVAVGRPVIWGLAVDGAAGVQRVLEILRDELSLAMALAGCRSLDEITRDLLA